MECPKDVQWYTAILQEEKVYVFLDGLNDQLDQTMMGNGSDKGMGVGLASKGLKMSPHPFGKDRVLVLNKSNPTGPNSKQRIEGLKCSHCGNSKHTRDT
ncbi:hypothetical protein CK203_051483 [Vitis vinifera]|uniref:Uncharacterized protein n=1 Tax=Vitis vinifera TaxID=29760 RepID=A0A438GDD5_VITVI|nr:hypothetical protein CK203_051483 [Vitis vinifera]